MYNDICELHDPYEYICLNAKEVEDHFNKIYKRTGYYIDTKALIKRQKGAKDSKQRLKEIKTSVYSTSENFSKTDALELLKPMFFTKCFKDTREIPIDKRMKAMSLEELESYGIITKKSCDSIKDMFMKSMPMMYEETDVSSLCKANGERLTINDITTARATLKFPDHDIDTYTVKLNPESKIVDTGYDYSCRFGSYVKIKVFKDRELYLHINLKDFYYSPMSLSKLSRNCKISFVRFITNDEDHYGSKKEDMGTPVMITKVFNSIFNGNLGIIPFFKTSFLLNEINAAIVLYAICDEFFHLLEPELQEKIKIEDTNKTLIKYIKSRK